MQRSGALAYLILTLAAVAVILLGVLVFQVDNLEQRFIVQGRQLRELGDATDRLGSHVDRLVREIRVGGVSARAGHGESDAYAQVQVLHPEVENFLEAKAFHWPPPGATLEGVLLRGWESGDPKGFNPLTESAADLSNLIEVYVASSLASRMAWTDPDRWYGDLAWRVEITDDFKEFTLYLRKGVLWHRPSGVDLDDPRYAWLAGEHELTARDLVFTLDMTMNPQVENSFIKSYYQDLESWEAIDDYTFRVRWKRKLYGNIMLTVGIAPIPEFLFAYEENGARVPDETIGLRFNQHWYANKGYVGTGPYRLASYEPGAHIRLVRNEDYPGEKPAIQEIVYPIYTDPSRTLLLLKSHEVSIGVLRPSQYREELLRWEDVPRERWPRDNPFLNGRIQCDLVTAFGYHYLGWNANKPIFADRRVRRAMTYALNREKIIANVFVGLGKVATGPFLASSPYNDPDIEPLPFDLDEARRLLEEAGWTDTDGDGLVDKDLTPDDADPTRTPFEFSLLIYGNAPEYTSTANIFKEDLLGIGVKLDIEAAEWSLMQKRMEEREFDAYTGGWALSWEPDPYQLWHSSQADVPKGSNMVGFRNAEADALIEKLRETFDLRERIRMLRRIHRIIHEEQPYTFFRVGENPVCWWDDVRDVVFSKTRPQVNTLPWWVAQGP